MKKLFLIFLIGLSSSAFTQEKTKTDSLTDKYMGARGEAMPNKRKLATQSKALQYKNIGPSRGGRVTAVSGVTDSTSTFYMGATGGGLWKTTDSGNHWKNISDGYFESPSIGAIAVYQNNPNIIYVGTGSDGIRSNIIVGKGVYKSTNAGKSWEHIGLKNAGQIGAVEIHPENPDIAYTAVIGQPFRKSKERGVYKTINGGKTWKQVLFVSDSVGAVDIELAPNNPNIIYAAMWRGERKPWTIISGDTTGGVFKSIDGGDTWKKIEKGLPQGLIGKIDFAVSKNKPERVWALIQAPNKEEGLYKSDDYGESWELITMPAKIEKSIMYRPFYFTNLNVNPKNADELWSGTKIFWTTKDAGKTWRKIPSYPHSDHHDMWVNPNNPEIMIAGNDGGASVSLDNGKNWSTLFNQNTAELYSCNVDDQYPYYLYSGQQDNTTIRVPSKRPYKSVLSSNDAHGLTDLLYWEATGGCETGPIIPKPGNSNIVYTNCKGQFGVYNHVTGFQQNYYIGAESLYGNHPDDITYRFQRVVPMQVSPHDPNIVYYGSQYIHKTSDGGVNWEQISPDLTANKPQYRMRSGGPIDEDISGEEYYNVLYAISESPLEEGVIWSGSNDGLIHITQNGGEDWINVTPNNLPEDGRVSNIYTSKHVKGKAFITINRDFLGDDSPYIYKTTDYGKTWLKIINGIPNDFPSRVVVEDSKREGLLFAGTEFGMFMSFDDGLHWLPFQQNLPIVPITDIKIFRNNLNISTLGRSFWIMEDISVLRAFKPDDKNQIKLYKPADVINNKAHTYFTTADLDDEEVVEFIYKNEAQDVVYKTIDTLKNYKINELGLRKHIWNLKHIIKVEGNEDFEGPRVSPEKYFVELKLKNKSLKQSFNYTLHPDLKSIGTRVEDLKAQEQLALKTAILYLEVKKEIKTLEGLLKKYKSERKKNKIKTQLALLKKGKERYDKPMLGDHIKYLYNMITDVQQELGKDAFKRYEQLYLTFQNLK